MSIKTVVVAAFSFAVIAFAGATNYSSELANRAVDEIAGEFAGGSSLLKLEELERQSGLVRSSGVYSVALDSSCIGGDVSLPELPAEIHYSVGHMPDATRLSSYTAAIKLTGEAGRAFQAAAGQSTVLLLEGKLGFDGQWTHRTRTPKITVEQDGVQATIAASEGEFTGAAPGAPGNGFAYAWSLPSIRVSVVDTTIEFSGLSAAGFMEDGQLGLGKQTIGINRIEASGDIPGGAALMSGIRFDYESGAADGRVSSSFAPSVEFVRAAGNTFQDMMFKVQLDGLDEQALREINQLSRRQCQAHLDDEQVARIERALLRIIDQGAALSVVDLKGRQLENSFGGEVIFTLDERGDGNGEPLKSMRERFSASSELRISRDLVPASLQDMLLDQGIMLANGEAWETTLSLKRGSLLINGITGSPAFSDSVDRFLVTADDGISNWHEQIVAGNGPLVTIARAARQQ